MSGCLWNATFLDEADVLNIIEEIPSDAESQVDDDDTLDTGNSNSEVENLNIESLPVFLEQENGTFDQIFEDIELGNEADNIHDVEISLNNIDSQLSTSIPDSTHTISNVRIDVSRPTSRVSNKKNKTNYKTILDKNYDEIPLSIRFHEELGFDWTRNNSNKSLDHKFNSQVGPNVPEDLGTPLDYFLHLFPHTLLDDIVFQTNLYCTQKKSGGDCFKPTSKYEIMAFLGINIMMGVKRLPSYRDYWSSDAALRDQFISSIMPLKRFEWLLSNIHLNNNENMPKKGEDRYDKLFKVRPLLDKLSETFLESYYPSEFQSVDESMIRFKGRSSIKQYMPKKPIKRGYKVWVCANESGYISQFQIYTGKVGQIAEKNLGARVVRDLTKQIEGKNHKVYFDNFFSSVYLVSDLQGVSIQACGTIRSDRLDYPVGKFVGDKSLKRGEFDCLSTTPGLLAIKLMDQRAIYLISNYHSANEVAVVKRKQKDGTVLEVPCPSAVREYNMHMGYVDKADMLKKCYELDRKSKKWWHRILFHFVDVSVVNTMILFNCNQQGANLSLKDFLLNLAQGLIYAGSQIQRTPPQRRGQKPVNNYKVKVPQERRTAGNLHLPIKGTRRRCAHCSARDEPHRSTWICRQCDVALCLSDTRNCFLSYHE